MPHDLRSLCSIVPPHILRHIAEHAQGPDRAMAYACLESSERIRGGREELGSIPALVSAPAGEKRRMVYDAGHRRALPGRPARGEGEAVSRDRAVNEAYEGAGRTYDFYRRVLQRNSIDDFGMRLDASVHYGTNFNNAQWNGRQMIYGDGDGRIFSRFTRSLDVVAHELTHGVTQYTAALEYYDQPGALNEHMSDVFGCLVRQYSLKQTASKADWIIGRGLFTKAIKGDGIRSMKAPGTAYDDPLLGRDPQPAHMSGYDSHDADRGGVHINSGIPNHAFYLAAVLLGGRAWEVAGRIWYHALTRKLQHNAQFRDAAAATHAAAVELYGTASAPAEAVMSGWRSVGVEVTPAIDKPGPRIRIRAGARIDVPQGGAELPVDQSRPSRARTESRTTPRR